MADEDDLIDEDEDEELNWMVIITAAVVLLVLIGGGVWYFFIREISEEERNRPPEYVAPESLVEEKVYVDMPDMIISPLDSRGRYYLIIKFDVVSNDQREVFNQMIMKPWKWAQALNVVIDIYGDYTREELRTPRVKEFAREHVLEEWNRIVGWEYDADLEALGQLPEPPLKALYYEKYILQ